MKFTIVGEYTIRMLLSGTFICVYAQVFLVCVVRKCIECDYVLPATFAAGGVFMRRRVAMVVSLRGLFQLLWI